MASNGELTFHLLRVEHPFFEVDAELHDGADHVDEAEGAAMLEADVAYVVVAR